MRKERGEGRFYHRGTEDTEGEEEGEKGERKGIERGGEKKRGKRKQGREFYHRGAESTEMEKGDQKLNLWQATGSDRKRQEATGMSLVPESGKGLNAEGKKGGARGSREGNFTTEARRAQRWRRVTKS